MIHISNIAQEHFSKLLLKQKKGTQIRIFVINPGTLNAECGISYCLPKTVKSDDIVLKFEKITVYIDKLSAPYLRDAEIDFISNKLNSQLTVKAPNIKKYKIDNNVSLIERINNLLTLYINPTLASHGGLVSVIEITEDGYAVLEFSGGCNGCSMINFTLKDGIEKHLLNAFPELKGVKDITKHQRNNYSYY